MPSVLPSYFAVTVTSVAKAKRARYAPPFSNAAGEAVSMTHARLLAGRTSSRHACADSLMYHQLSKSAQSSAQTFMFSSPGHFSFMMVSALPGRA